jgi:hypothetical protein
MGQGGVRTPPVIEMDRTGFIEMKVSSKQDYPSSTEIQDRITGFQ